MLPYGVRVVADGIQGGAVGLDNFIYGCTITKRDMAIGDRFRWAVAKDWRGRWYVNCQFHVKQSVGAMLRHFGVRLHIPRASEISTLVYWQFRICMGLTRELPFTAFWAVLPAWASAVTARPRPLMAAVLALKRSPPAPNKRMMTNIHSFLIHVAYPCRSPPCR